MDNIIGKTISGFIMLLVTMGILIFLPAWTVNIRFKRRTGSKRARLAKAF